jgi:hypothetical protein
MTLGISLQLPNNAVLTAPNPATATSTLAGIHAAKINQGLQENFASAILLVCSEVIDLHKGTATPKPDTKIVDLCRNLVKNQDALNNMAKNAIIAALSQGYIIANASNVSNGVFDHSTVSDDLILAFISGVVNFPALLLEII